MVQKEPGGALVVLCAHPPTFLFIVACLLVIWRDNPEYCCSRKCGFLAVHAPPLQEGIQLGLNRYPETLQVELGVAAMGVESSEGTFIQTGAQLRRLRSATDLTGGRACSAASARVWVGHGWDRKSRLALGRLGTAKGGIQRQDLCLQQPACARFHTKTDCHARAPFLDLLCSAAPAEEMEGAAEPAAARALAVTFVQKPQDGSADAALDVSLMPSYVYYSGAIGRLLPGKRMQLMGCTRCRAASCALMLGGCCAHQPCPTQPALCPAAAACSECH